MEMDPGTVLAERFQIEEKIGAGGMGTVVRARDLHGGGHVAIKILHKSNPSAYEQERFAREAQMLAELNDPSIVAYVAHGQTPEGRRFLAMEWLNGEDLERRLRRERLTVSETVLLLRAVARALHKVHEQGLIHREPKPADSST